MSIEVKICLGCYASYNDGYLYDTWYTVTDESDLDEAIEKFQAHVMKSIKKDRPDWVKDGYIQETYAEEIYVADSEVEIDGNFINIDFKESICAVREILGVFDESYSHPIALLLQVMKNNGQGYDDLKEIDDNLFSFEIDSKSNFDIGYAYAELTDLMGSSQACETLKNYFDYEAFGRDLYATTYNIDGTYYAVLDN